MIISMTRKITSVLFMSAILFTAALAASVTLMQDTDAYTGIGSPVKTIMTLKLFETSSYNWSEDPGLLADLNAYESVPALLRLLEKGRSPREVIRALRILAPEEILPAFSKLLEKGDPAARKRTLEMISLGLNPHPMLT